MTLAGKTILISGGSRGIGLAIALRAARDGANVALIAKTDQPHPKLEGTIHTAAAAIEEASGKALPILGDVRDEDRVAGAVAETVERFGGIDVCVNNASAINLVGTEQIEMKRYDLMQDINARGTFVLSKLAIPHLRESANPHVLTLSPPLSLSACARRSRISIPRTSARLTRPPARTKCSARPVTSRCGLVTWNQPGMRMPKAKSRAMSGSSSGRAAPAIRSKAMPCSCRRSQYRRSAANCRSLS